MKLLFPYLLSIFLFSGLTIFAQQKDLDEIPMPVGGIEEIAQNVVYPQSAKETKVEGKVIVKAVIDEDGKVKIRYPD